MGDKLIEIQHQIRNNATNIREYIDDLSSWEAEMNHLDNSLTQKTYPLAEPPPIRSKVEEIKKDQQETVLKRDKAKMQDYYKAWDKYNVDSELEKLEDTPPTFQTPKTIAKPQSKVVVRGGRAVNSEIDRLKDQGNLEFTSKEYAKALEKYQECLTKSVPNDIKIILHSNSAECYLRLKNGEKALEEAENALGIDSKHVKSLLRRAKAKKILGKYKSSQSDLEECLSLDPKNAAVLTEKVKLSKKRAALLEEAKAKMVNKSRVPPTDLINIQVLEINSLKPEEKKDAIDLKEQTSRAIDSISVEKLPIPKNLVEFERNWVMLSDIKKLKTYLDSIPNEHITTIIQKGNIETDFVMRIINTFLQNFTHFQDIAQNYLFAIVSSKKISVLAKFLTKKEKNNIQELLGLLGNPKGFEVFI